MRSVFTVALALTIAAIVAAPGLAADAPAGKKINVAVITGGHGFEEAEFFKLFEGYDDIVYTHLPQQEGGEAFEDISNWPYDVMVLYNFAQKITPKQQENFKKLLDKGVGLFVLHHANAAYTNWPEFWKIAGVEYHFGVSGFKGGVNFKVHVADPNHPITRGLADYDITDETYCKTTVDPNNHVLLTTDEPSSDKVVGWAKTYANAKVCYIQSGHDHVAYQNPTYRTIVVRSVRWAAGQLD